MKALLKIKVCGMVNKENIEAIAAATPDYIGFIFYPPSPRYAGKLTFTQISALPAQIKTTGVFVNEDADTLISIVRKLKLKAIQLHGEESVEFCKVLRQTFPDLKIIKVFRIHDAFDFAQTQSYEMFVNFFLFDTHSVLRGGTGHSFNWELLHTYKGEVSFFLSGGIGPEHITSIQKMDHARLYGVDINSRFEIEPGIKNSAEIGKFILDIKNLNN